MKSLAVAVVSMVLVSSFPALAAGHGGHGGSRGSHGAGHFSGHSGGHSPMWRHPNFAGHFTHHPRFSFRGHSFIFIGAPLFVAPWLRYPYVWDAEWGPRYYVPGQPGYFLYYCPNPRGYYPDVVNCPAGWLPVVPNEAMDPGY